MRRASQHWLVRLYPPGWRERYGGEFSALLEQSLRSPLDVLDVLLGALDAHLQMPMDVDMNWRKMDMVNKLRTMVLLVFVSFVIFVGVGLAFNGMMDDTPLNGMMQAHPVWLSAYTLVEIGSVAALLAILVGGAPIALAVLKRAFTSARRDLALLATPVISVVLVALYIVFLVAITHAWITLPGVPATIPAGATRTPADLGLAFGLVGLVFAAAVASTIAIWAVVQRSEVEDYTFRLGGARSTVALYRFAYLPAVITVLAMLVMALAVIVWGLVAVTVDAGFFAAPYGYMGMAAGPYWLAVVLVMLLSTGLGGWAVLRGAVARRMADQAA